MKNVFFTLVFLFTVTFTYASASGTFEYNDNSKEVEKIHGQNNTDPYFDTESLIVSIQFEILAGEDRPCRWRTCITRNGVRTCGEWTYGECLDEVTVIGVK